MKVVFILGSGHCGSTLLDLMLDRHPSVTGVGEMHTLRPDSLCTCGKRATECPFWSQVAKDAIGDRQDIYRTKLSFLRGRRTFLAAATGKPVDARELRDRILTMYRRMGTDVIVDSSKNVDRAELLSMDASIEPILIHLVRDGRAVTWSYLRKYHEFLPYFPKWFLENIKVEIFKRRSRGKTMRIRYEDLTADPRRVLTLVCEVIGVPYDPAMLAFREGIHHELEGNRMRFGTDAAIQTDTEWRGEMPFRDRLAFDACFGWLNVWYMLNPSSMSGIG